MVNSVQKIEKITLVQINLFYSGLESVHHNFPSRPPSLSQLAVRIQLT